MKNSNPPYINSPSLFPFLNRISTRSFFIFVFILQMILIFQGFDLSDEGFLSIFYRRIFSNPESVSYNFMFWLTGIIGGLWVKLFSPLGLLGIRLGGAIVNTLTVILTYNLLKKYLNPEYLKIGLILVVLCLNNDIKVLNYNTLSSLFYIFIIYFLFTGLQNNQTLKIFMSGFFIGLNVFIRAPNILELGLVLGFVYHYYLFPESGNHLVKQITGFFSGFLVALATVLSLMWLMGHLQIFIDSVKLLLTMSKSEPIKDVTRNGYGISRLLFIFWSNNVQSLKYALFTSAFVLISIYFLQQIRIKIKHGNRIALVILSGIIGFVLFLTVNHWISHFVVLFFLTGLILLTSVPMFTSPLNNRLKILLFFGLFFMITFPLGSSDGVFTAGRYCLWIALPVTADYLLKIQSLQNRLVVHRDKLEYEKKVWFTENQLTVTKKILFYLLFFAGLYQLYYYPFFDRRNRNAMHYSLHSENLRGIYTTKGRALAFNELLNESRKYVKPNDLVLAYDHIAMYYFATNSTPFLSNSLPSVYSAGMFRADLKASYERNRMLPAVIIQKIGTTGEASKWPEEILPGNYAENAANLDRNHILDTFLIKNNYKQAWENVAFKILLPDKTNEMMK
jgi:hypothetical protein